VVTRKFDPPMSRAAAREIIALYGTWPLVQIDVPLLLAASEPEQERVRSFWDALVVEAARRAGVAPLATADLQEGRTVAGVRIENRFARRNEPPVADAARHGRLLRGDDHGQAPRRATVPRECSGHGAGHRARAGASAPALGCWCGSVGQCPRPDPRYAWWSQTTWPARTARGSSTPERGWRPHRSRSGRRARPWSRRCTCSTPCRSHRWSPRYAACTHPTCRWPP
jgi:hypothetical protein